jgi:hypothetical protein
LFDLSSGATFGGSANKPSVLAKREVNPCGGNSDAEFGGDTSSRLLALPREGPHRSPLLFQYRRWRGFGRAAVEWRLRRIDHVKLDGLSGLLTAQLGREMQSPVDAQP